MSEQKTAKELANGLRRCAGAGGALEIVQGAAAELDRLADLCARQAGELDAAKESLKSARSIGLRMYGDRNQCHARIAELEKERDAVKGELAAAVEHAKRLVDECGKLRDEVARLSRWNAQVCKDRDAARQELVTMTGDRDALAEGVRAYRDVVQSMFWEESKLASETMKAWERKHGHRADAGKEPARKSDEVKPQTVVITNNTNVPVNATMTFQVGDPMPWSFKVEEKPPLLDLRTLPVGTVCEAVTEIRCAGGSPIKSGERFTIKTQEPEDYDGMMPVQVTYGGREPWLFANQSARVISKPEPAPEPFRDLPALALRRAHKEWQAERFQTWGLAWHENGTKFSWNIDRVEDPNPMLFSEKTFTDEKHRIRPHGATWHEVELKAARLLGKKQGECPKGCFADHAGWLRSELGITDSTRDMNALWAAFREGQKS